LFIQFPGAIKAEVSTNPKTVAGVYRDGRVELAEKPSGISEAKVIVTFLTPGVVNLSERGIDETEAASLRARLNSFAQDWEAPEMEIYDDL
jgi:hypothetical protein